MTITAHHNFDSTVKWAKGSGCLACGSNVSTLGAEVGVQCISLGARDDFLGHFGLCYDCGLQVARVLHCVPRSEAVEILEQARQIADEATTESEEVLAAAAQARIDRDVVERLVGSVYLEADAKLVDAVASSL
jgi:hypothetical protein